MPELQLTGKSITAAHEALFSGDMEKIRNIWAEDVRFQVASHHPRSGWFYGIDAVLEMVQWFMGITGSSYKMESFATLVNAETGWTVDASHTYAIREGADPNSLSPYEVLRVDVLYMMRWENGKVVECRVALPGDDANNLVLFLSPVNGDDQLKARGEVPHPKKK
jgi:uncharacterized protein